MFHGDGALQEDVGMEPPGSLRDVACAGLELGHRAAGDYPQAGRTSEDVDQLVGQAVRQVLGVGVGSQVDKTERRYRFGLRFRRLRIV